MVEYCKLNEIGKINIYGSTNRYSTNELINYENNTH